MYNYNIFQWLAFFYVYCILGWCFESIYVSMKSKNWINRGFLYGPFLPLYGSGAVLIMIISNRFVGNIILVCIVGIMGVTALEYITGVVMEALFKIRYWDYSNRKINFQGRICLSASITWGLMILFLTQVLHDSIENIVFSLPTKLLMIEVLFITFWVSVDFALSFRDAFELRNILLQMEKAKDELANIQRRIDIVIAVIDDEIGNRKKIIVDELEERKRYFESVIYLRRNDLDMMKTSIEQGLDKISFGTIEDIEFSKWLKGEISDASNNFFENLHTIKRLFGDKMKKNQKILRAYPSITSKKFKDALDELKNRMNNGKE